VRLSTRASESDLDAFDHVVIAAYANSNAPLPTSHAGKREQYQFELCEKPVVSLPESFGKMGIVVMDGPFMCVDPFGTSGNYVLGNVVHAIHKTSIGYEPEVPDEYKSLLNKGVVENPPLTNFDAFVESGSRYIPVLKQARHVGSMYTIRTVLPNLDKTDARPTLVHVLDDKYVRIFSGKIGNCVDAAKEVIAIIEDSSGASHEAVIREHRMSRQ